MDKRRIGVRAIIFKDGRLLAVKHKSEDGTAKDYWAVPGGGLDPGESLEDGLKREMKEELNADVKVGRLLFIQQFMSGREECDEELEFFFLVENPDDCAVEGVKHSSHGAHELAHCDYIDAAKESIRPRFLGTVDLAHYVNTIQPIYIANLLKEDE